MRSGHVGLFVSMFKQISLHSFTVQLTKEDTVKTFTDINSDWIQKPPSGCFNAGLIGFHV